MRCPRPGPRYEGPGRRRAGAGRDQEARRHREVPRQLRGKILLLGEAREYKRGTEPDSHRHDATSLEGLQEFTLPKDKDATAERAKRVKEYQERQQLAAKVNAFFVEEGALASISISSWDNGIIRVAGGGSRKPVSRWASPNWR